MKKGFTLVELSIVLVIIGLLVGGILTGQELIRQAQLNSVISDFNKFQVAINTFDLQYSGFPGDFDEAAEYWGNDCAGGSGTDVCSGDGDGDIDMTGEQFRAWQHLSLAEILQGDFTGVTGSGGTRYAIINENVPASNIDGGGYSFYRSNFTPPHTQRFSTESGKNHIEFGSQATLFETYYPILKPSEAKNIDQKIDDGKPGLGGVITTHQISSGQKCATSSSPSTAKYNVSDDRVICNLFLLLE